MGDDKIAALAQRAFQRIEGRHHHRGDAPDRQICGPGDEAIHAAVPPGTADMGLHAGENVGHRQRRGESGRIADRGQRGAGHASRHNSPARHSE